MEKQYRAQCGVDRYQAFRPGTYRLAAEAGISNRFGLAGRYACHLIISLIPRGFSCPEDA